MLTGISFLIYGVAGAFAYASTSSFGRSALAGLVVASAEATIGWWFSTQLGASKAGPGTVAPALLIITWGMVAASGALFGSLGGALTWWRRRSTRGTA